MVRGCRHRLTRQRNRSSWLAVEPFERRLFLATDVSINAFGDCLWSTVGNWGLGRIPITGDDVTIPDLGTPRRGRIDGDLKRGEAAPHEIPEATGACSETSRHSAGARHGAG
jgi:hypothetical protein